MHLKSEVLHYFVLYIVKICHIFDFFALFGLLLQKVRIVALYEGFFLFLTVQIHVGLKRKLNQKRKEKIIQFLLGGSRPRTPIKLQAEGSPYSLTDNSWVFSRIVIDVGL